MKHGVKMSWHLIGIPSAVFALLWLLACSTPSGQVHSESVPSSFGPDERVGAYGLMFPVDTPFSSGATPPDTGEGNRPPDILSPILRPVGRVLNPDEYGRTEVPPDYFPHAGAWSAPVIHRATPERVGPFRNSDLITIEPEEGEDDTDAVRDDDQE